MNRIQLPPQIGSNGLLPFLAQLGQPLSNGGVEMDFSKLRRITPAGAVALVAIVDYWRKRGREVAFEGLQQCSILNYLQRMDILKACGVELPEEFHRQASHGRFMPVRPVSHPIEAMGHEVAACLAPGGEEYEHPLSGLYEMIWYALTEMGNNIRQHSGGAGFASAQVNPREGLVRLALADNGMGILRSFQIIDVPWSLNASDAEAISKALESRISCKSGEPNEGVGLTLVSALVSLMRGWLLVVSGSGVLKTSRDGRHSLEELPDGGYYHGTLVAMSFPPSAASDFAGLLQEAKVKKEVLPRGPGRATFEA
jgi:hypothetical protein